MIEAMSFDSAPRRPWSELAAAHHCRRLGPRRHPPSSRHYEELWREGVAELVAALDVEHPEDRAAAPKVPPPPPAGLVPAHLPFALPPAVCLRFDRAQ